MTELFSLINGLNQEEIKAVKYSFKKTGEDDDGLYLEELCSIILSARGKPIPDTELSIAIYSKEKLSAIAKLKSRLFQYILEVLSSDAYLSKEQFFDPADKQIIRTRKKMLQFRVLYRKKNKTDSIVLFHLLSEIIKEAKEYEQYDILIDALYFKKTMLMIRKGFGEVKQIEKQIEYCQYSYKAFLKTADHYFEIISNQELLQQTNPGRLKEMLREAITEMEEFIKNTDSATIKYFCKQLQLDEMIRENKHTNSIDTCLDILNILNKHKHIYRGERVGVVYNNISICQVHRNDFDDAIASAQKAQEYYSEGSFNLMISKQQEFLACFYGSSYNRAHTIVTDLLQFPVSNSGDFRHDKHLLFQASVLFKLGEYREALITGNKALEVTKDKGRWDLGARYLRLLCMIELELHDPAYSAIEALRKALKRSEDGITLRDELIYRAFNEFASTGFSNIPTPKLIEALTELSLKDAATSWQYYNHEMIPIHKWIESKITLKTGVATSKVSGRR
ncbi:MAG: tetratricopeptide repeat protein [Bacteroidia bacterium]